MIPVSTAAETRALDQACIQGLGIPARQLMELAGHGAARQIHARWPGAAAAVLCGPGNNGGDGYVIARWLQLWGHPVRLWAPRPPSSPEAQENAALCATMGLLPLPLAEALAGARLLVDAMLGTGQQAAPTGWAAEGLAALCHAAPGTLRIAVDLPTGLHADTGQVLGPPLPDFDLTLCLGRLKPGLLCAPGLHLAGQVERVDIGLELAARVDPALVEAGIAVVEASDLAPIAERPDAAKWNRGHVAIRAGGGAAVLAAHGAFRGRVGLVTLLAPRDQWSSFHGLWPEVILAEPAALDPARHDALVLGPGLGLSAEAEILALWRGFEGPVLADADALRVLASAGPLPTPAGVRVLTPHKAEAGHLLGCPAEEVDADRFRAVRALRRWGSPLLKGPHSLVGGADRVWVVPRGCAALATAGTGDVLAGLAGAFLARGLPAEQALCLAAWRHGAAGEAMPPGGTARDLVEALRVEHR